MLEMLGTNILLKNSKQEEAKAKNGIVRPVSASETGLKKFEVVSVGPGGYRQNGEFQKIEDISSGDFVVVDKTSVVSYNVGTQEYFIVGYRDVLAKHKKD